MKKLVLTFLIFYSFYNIVCAETFYGNYKKVDNIDNYPFDMIKIESKKLYNTYTLKKIDMGYIDKNDNYLIDSNDYIKEYVNVPSDSISDEYINITTDVSKENHFIIGGLKEDTKIYEIEIFSNDEKIVLSTLTAHLSIVYKIMDGNFDTYITGEEINRFFLYANITEDIENYKINIYTKDNKDYDLNIMIGGKEIPFTLKTHNKDKHIISFKYENKKGYNVSYEYKGYKKLYKHYKEEKELLNNYVDVGENIEINDFLEIKNYYFRDKLVLKDNFIINNYNQNITDFIEYSSGKVNIISNVDYKKNGVYNCQFQLNDINVDKEIIIDIPRDKNLINKKINNYVYDNKIKNEDISTSKIIVKQEKVTKKNKESKKSNKLKKLKYIIFLNLIIIEILFLIKKKKK